DRRAWRRLPGRVRLGVQLHKEVMHEFAYRVDGQSYRGTASGHSAAADRVQRCSNRRFEIRAVRLDGQRRKWRDIGRPVWANDFSLDVHRTAVSAGTRSRTGYRLEIDGSGGSPGQGKELLRPLARHLRFSGAGVLQEARFQPVWGN